MVKRENEPKPPRTLDMAQSGVKPEAVIVDVDGTLENWDGVHNKLGMEYVREQHALGRVIIVVTARDHETSYNRTHAWLKANLPVPFVGPLCRSLTDRRYASAFKQDVFERLSALYEIVGAIDDNEWVLDMWREVGVEAVQTFDSPPRPRLKFDYTDWWLDEGAEPDENSPWWADFDRRHGLGGKKRRRRRNRRRWR